MPYDTDYMTDEQFRMTYAPLVDHFGKWRARLNKALGLEENGSMEMIVCKVEIMTAERSILGNVVSIRKDREKE